MRLLIALENMLDVSSPMNEMWTEPSRERRCASGPVHVLNGSSDSWEGVNGEDGGGMIWGDVGIEGREPEGD